MERDAAATLRTVSALRALCLRLPHLPTPAEAERLRRFEWLVQRPEAITPGDADALAAGWRRWWRDGRWREIAGMAASVPPGHCGR
jgi:hypothetical protein